MCGPDAHCLNAHREQAADVHYHRHRHPHVNTTTVAQKTKQKTTKLSGGCFDFTPAAR